MSDSRGPVYDPDDSLAGLEDEEERLEHTRVDYSGVEVSRKLETRVRGVEHERRFRPPGAVQDDGCGVERHGRTQIGLQNKSLAGRPALCS